LFSALSLAGCQFLSNLDDYTVAPAPTVSPIDSVWSKSYGGAGEDGGNEVAIDQDGNVIVVGALASTTSFGGTEVMPIGMKDAFILKLDRDGNYIWDRVYGGTDDDAAIDVAVNPDGSMVVAGLFVGEIDFGLGNTLQGPPGRRSMFVLKLDPEGQPVWARGFGDLLAIPIPYVAIGGDGSIFLTGGLRGTVDFGGGPLSSVGSFDVFLAKFNPDGGHVWSHAFGTAVSSLPDPLFAARTAGLRIDDDGSVLVGAVYETSVDVLGEVHTGPGPKRMWIARIDPGGASAPWVRDFGSDGDTVALTTSLTAKHFVVAGGFAGALQIEDQTYIAAEEHRDVFVSRFDKITGGHVATSTFAATVVRKTGELMPRVTAVVTMDVNARDEVLIAGMLIDKLVLGGTTLQALGQSEHDLFAAKLSSNGTPLLAERYGDDNRQTASGGALDAAGNVLVTGNFEGQLLFGSERHVSKGAQDIFVVKLVPE
jgi:hypothetical protein